MTDQNYTRPESRFDSAVETLVNIVYAVLTLVTIGLIILSAKYD